MGGKSEQTTTQSSTTAPWEAAQPAIQGILGKLGGLVNNSGLSSTSRDAISQLEQNAQAGNPFSGQITSIAENLLNGGGANNQAGNISGALDTFRQQTSPLASNTNYDPMQTPGLADALNTLKSDITGSINGQFAAAGRDLSGMNGQTLARGLTQGLAPVIVDQYNKNVANQQGAAQNLYNAGNTSAGLLSGLQQQGLVNQLQGAQTSQDALAAQNYAPTQILNLEQLKQSLPAQNLGLLAQIGIPIAGLGSQSSGTSNTEKQASGAEQFAQIAGGLGNIGKFLFSDMHLKTDIEPVGTLFNGLTIYRYRYGDSPEYHIGVLAHEVEKIRPDAVVHMPGVSVVDYKAATETAQLIGEAA